MLHILLVILKIIGIILAAILGILVLLVCVVLIVPIRYRVCAKYDGTPDTAKGKANITWLLHLVSVSVILDQKKVRWRARILWKTMTSETPVRSDSDKPADNIKKKREKEGIADEKAAESIEKSNREEPEEVVRERPQIQEKDAEEAEEAVGCGGEDAESAEKEDEEESGLSKRGETKHEETEKNRKKTLIDRVRDLIQKIKCTITGICDRIKTLSKRKDTVKAFLQDTVHKKAFSKLKTEFMRLLGRLKPRKLTARVHYGFEDPCLTGQVLAGFSVLYPFIGKNVSIVPNFNQKVLEGDIDTRGKIRALYFLILAWKLFWTKEVRATYRHIKNFEW